MHIIDLNTPKAHMLYCVKGRGGKRAHWNAYHQQDVQDAGFSDLPQIVGYGNTADNAIKDYQKQFRACVRNWKLAQEKIKPPIQ